MRARAAGNEGAGVTDAKRGSERYKKLLAVKFDREPVFTRTERGRWCCEIPGSGITPGVGHTKNDAYVDFVEEAEELSVFFRGEPYVDDGLWNFALKARR